MDYRRLIESGFEIIDKQGRRGPFNLNNVQAYYFNLLQRDYPTMEGIRENIIKARQEGMSAFIDAMFLVDFLTKENVGAQIISHKDEETELLMKRVHFYLDTWLEKRGLDRKHILKTDQLNFIESKINGSYIYIGTAGAKTLGRGNTLQNIHWSECGFYPNTEVINAEKLVAGAEQQVALTTGKIFRESTGNMAGDFFYDEVERSRMGTSRFKYRFFPWYLNNEYRLDVEHFEPTVDERGMMDRFNLDTAQMAWYRVKGSEFKTRALFLREYPTTVEEAFLAGGDTYYDADTLKYYKDNVKTPIRKGNLAGDGMWI